MIQPQNSNKTPTIEQLEAEAQRLALQDRSMTVEQHFVRLLELHPATYSAFKAKHDVAPLVAALGRAGLTLHR